MNVPYLDLLTEARNFLEHDIPEFPILKCQVASRFVNLVFGFEEVAGYYHGRIDGFKNRVSESHAWSYDKTLNLYLDITIDQFTKNLPRVLITTAPHPILKPVSEFTDEQKSLLNEELDETLEQLVSDFQKMHSETLSYLDCSRISLNSYN
jgi:hypothetical protein